MYVYVHMHAAKACGGADLTLHSLVMSSLDGGEWSASGLGPLLSGKRRYPLNKRLDRP
jgi:hypothetical protein